MASQLWMRGKSLDSQCWEEADSSDRTLSADTWQTGRQLKDRQEDKGRSAAQLKSLNYFLKNNYYRIKRLSLNWLLFKSKTVLLLSIVCLVDLLSSPHRLQCLSQDCLGEGQKDILVIIWRFTAPSKGGSKQYCENCWPRDFNMIISEKCNNWFFQLHWRKLFFFCCCCVCFFFFNLKSP